MQFKHHVSLSVVKVGYCQVNHREVKRRESRLRSGLGPLRVFSISYVRARAQIVVYERTQENSERT